MRLSLRAKIISGFVSIFVIGMVLGVYGLYSINNISMMSMKQSIIEDASNSVSNVLVAHYSWRQNLTVAVYSNTEFTGSYNPDSCALGTWKNSEEATSTANSEVISLLSKLDEPHNFIHSEAKKVMEMMKEGQITEAQKIFTEMILPQADNAISLLGQMSEQYDIMLETQVKSIHDFQSRTLIIIVSLLIFATILSAFLAIAIIQSILKPLNTLANSANMVAAGNFNVNFKYPVNDEIGKLTNSFAILVNMFKMLVNDLNNMAGKHSAGEVDYIIESNKYSGEFKDVTHSINSMIKEYIENVEAVLGITQKYAEGEFSAKLDAFPGKKAIANITLDSVSDNLKNVEKSVMTLVESALAGNLDKRIDNSAFKGGWKSIVEGMNKLLEVVDAPLIEAQNVLLFVSQGKLDVKITGKYNGQFEKMSESINNTIEVLSLYITEISETLNKLASDNFNIVINRDYVGSFSDIKISLNAIISRLNNVMREIGTAAEQVADGSAQVSKTSMALSQGALEQASAVEELNATIDEIYTKVVETAENSTNANRFAAIAKSDAEHGNTEMSKMLNSMTDINASSQDISKIIKVIEDIAFQTNLLALNAAVEAARAGEHGKGFVVVAEEVRRLAAVSQTSAKETADLIERSMRTVNEGTTIANNTAEALLKIITGVEDVSQIINKIEISSKEQAASVSQITEGIAQISQVTQKNSATSQESAAASEELSSQSETLKTMFSRFELRK